MHKSHTLLSGDEWSRLDARLREADEDRWLSSRYAPEAGRRALVALYAFNYELAKVRTVVKEPGLGAIRFQWWRDALDEIAAQKEPRRHDVVRAIYTTQLPTERLEALIDGHQNAYDAADRQLEPEVELMSLAAEQLGPDMELEAPSLSVLATAFGAARRGEMVTDRPRARKWPSRLRPALAHATLTGHYTPDTVPGPLSKRWLVLRAVLTGRV